MPTSMSDTDLEQFVWDALAEFPVRRAMLGRERCDAIVATVVQERPSQISMAAARAWYADPQRSVRQDLERRVWSVYRDRCGFPVTTMILCWVISAIVQILVAKWWEQINE